MNKKKYPPLILLRKEREQRNWTYADVADRIELTDSHAVGRWERGEIFPGPRYRRALCRIFEKSAAELGLVKPQQVDTDEPLSNPLPWKIPPLTSPLIGREHDVGEVCGLLKRSDVRLVTLLGAGGVGKTSLALGVAQVVEPDFPEGGCFISLDAVTDPALVLPTCAKELGIQESESLSLVGHLKTILRDKPFLLVLDNFEQVGLAARDVADLLAACPDLKVLVTSRAVLHLPVEHQFLVQSLTLPDLTQEVTADDLLHYSSIALFMQRTRAILPDFHLEPSNVQAVAEICVRLDGLPLAIELAVSRIKLLSPRLLLERLSHGFQVLKGVLQTLPERHKTLYKNITWSYDLLNADEKWLLRRLSVFLGGGTLETIEELFNGHIDQSLDVLSTLSSLLDQSMVQREVISDGGVRFTLLETIRGYGREYLRQEGEFEEVQRAHALHYLTLAEEGQMYLKGPQQTEWLAILDAEIGNLRTALQWFIEHKEGEMALRLCEAFGKFCGLRGYWREEQHWFQVVLALPEASLPTMMRARVLRRAGHLAYRFRDLSTARAWHEESVRLSQQLGDLHNLVGALIGLGLVQYRGNDMCSAGLSFEESLVVAHACGDKWALANSLERLGHFAYTQGDIARARTLLEESITLSRTILDKESLSRGLTTLVSIELSLDNFSQAELLARESFQLAKELGTKPLYALALDSLVDVALYCGQYEHALDLVNERITLAQALGDTPTILKKRLTLGEIAVEQGDPSWVFSLVQESLEFFRQQADYPNIALALGILGDIELANEDFEQAKIFYKEAVPLYKETGNKITVAKHSIRQAKLCKKRGYIEGVALLILSAAEIWQGRLPPALRNEYEKMREWLRTQMDETAFEEWQSEDRAMMLEQLLDLLKPDAENE